MNSKTLTAAIQFGSSRICAAAAWIDKNGHYEVTAIESASSTGCIRHGCVVSIDETAGRIKSLMQKLSNRVKTQGYGGLDAAYVGICGMSMHSMEYHPAVLAGEDLIITGEIRQLLSQQSMNLKVPDYDIVGLHSNGEHIEGQHVIGHHQLILAESRLKNGILSAMERAHMRVAGVYATPLLLGDMLTDEEKQKGCLLIDLGAQLTTISIYANNELKFLTVLPLGGDTVTQDIATQGMRFDEAEELKQKWSNASRMSENIQGSLAMPSSISLKELNVIVASRFEEIIANVANQVEKAGYKGLLEGGCILTGGASIQKGLTAILSKRLEIGRICTRSCSNIRFGSSERKPNLASLMSMLIYCNESCEVKQVEKTLPEPPVTKPTSTIDLSSTRKKTTGGIRDFFGDLFSGIDEN